MKVRIVTHPVRHQVAAIRPFAEPRVKTHTPRRAARPSQQRRGAREKFQINRRIQPQPAQPREHHGHRPQQTEEAVVGQGDDILRRDDAQRIDDEPVVLKDRHENPFAPHPPHRILERAMGEHRRALLRELHKKDRAHRTG